MRIVKLTILLTMLALSIAASAATPIVFKLKPIQLANGWEVTGTITTDGKGIFVATSPDGIQDGGTLYFSRGGGGERSQPVLPSPTLHS